MQQLKYVTKIGAEIEELFEPLAKLRIEVFYDFPYLYQGTVAYEMEYLKTYSTSSKGFLFAVFDGQKMIGATTCIPLSDETEEVQAPFIASQYNPSEVCYFGESILKHSYRGLGIGHRFFDEREQYARTMGGMKWTSFCAVQRPANHPLQPADYRPNDAFWQKRGYRQVPALQTYFSWPDRGETISTDKPMVYWIRSVNQD